MPEPIVFYDVACKVRGKAWSPNTWKTRYCLNIKQIPYKTVWVEYPDIVALCQKIGAPAGEKRRDGSSLYTLPVIFDPNTNTAVSESAAIARYLDKTYSNTYTLIPTETDALHAAFQYALTRATLTADLLAIMVPAVHDALNPASQPYFRATREKRFDKRLEEIAPPGSETRAKHWEAVKNGYHTVAGWQGSGSLEGGEGRLLFGGDRVWERIARNGRM